MLKVFAAVLFDVAALDTKLRSPIHSPCASVKGPPLGGRTKGHKQSSTLSSTADNARSTTATSMRERTASIKRGPKRSGPMAIDDSLKDEPKQDEEEEEDTEFRQLEGVRLMIFLLGNVCPISRRNSGM